MPDYSKYFATTPGAPKEEPVTSMPVDLSATVNAPRTADQSLDFSKYMGEPVPLIDKTVHHTVARTSTPETEAEIIEIYGKTGLPQSIIRGNMDAARTRAEYSTLVTDAEGSPKLLGFIQDPLNMAAVRDDVPALSVVEATLAHQIKTDITETLEDIPAGFKRGQEVVTRGQLYSELSNAIITGADQVEIQDRITAFEEEAKAAASKGGWLESAAEMLPILGHSMIAGQAEGAKYATIGAAGSLITGGITAPAAAGIMYGAGVTVGTINEIFNLERGNALAEFTELTDETGAPMDPLVANAAAIGVGAINAGLEFVGLKAISKVIPGGDKLVGKFTRDAVKKALMDPSVRRTLAAVSRKYATGITTETITEMGQEIVNILGAAAAKAVSDQDFGPDDILSPENMGRVMEAGEMAFKATVVLGGAGAGVSAVRGVRKTEKQIADQVAFVEQTTAVDESIASTKTAEQNPAMMEKFLADTMGLKDQDAFVDGEVILELEQTSPEILDEIVQEMGASKDKILEAANQGRPARLNMGAYHARLSPEAKSALFSGLKATPGSYSASQVEQGMAQSTDSFEDQFNGFVAQNEAINTEISRIEQESFNAGAAPRVAAQTAQIAARMAMSMADNTVDGNAAAVMQKIQFAPLAVRDPDGVGYDQAGQLQTDTPEFKNWFGDSKVVDDKGKPLIVYHGTRKGGFEFFKGKYRKDEQLGFGLHFAVDEDFADRYAVDEDVSRPGKMPQTYDVILSAKNVLDADAIVSEGSREFALALILGGKNRFYPKNEKGVRSVYVQNAIDWTSPKRAEKLIKGAGYDGIKYRAAIRGQAGVTSESISYVVFEPTQIKSATANIGAFDPTDPNIYSQMVYHGTPHNWEPEPGFPHGRPRLDMIGEGEGAQAYGWGWYSAESQDVAKSYAPRDFDYEDSLMNLYKAAESTENWAAMEVYEAAMLHGTISELEEQFTADMGYDDDFLDSAEVAIERIEEIELSGTALYKLDIPETVIGDMVDWDNPPDSQTMEAILDEAEAQDWGEQDIEGLQDAMGLTEMYRDQPESMGSIYGLIASTLGSDQAASDFMLDAGFAGTRYFDQGSRTDGKGTYNYVIWDQDALDEIALLERNGKKLDATKDLYEQADKVAKARGNVQVFDDKYLVSLFEAANESTPFHELGHVFLSEMQNIVSQGAATQQMVDDLNTINDWAGVINDPEVFQEQYAKYRPNAFEDRTLGSLTDSERAQAAEIMKHEYFARGFESYLMEGKAPAPELIPAFRRFARWLKVIYKKIGALDVKLTAPIRNIFDRMLQSEFEIEGAMEDAGLQPLTVAEMDAMGILSEDRDYLKRLHQEAQTEAERKLTAARIQGVKNQRKDWEAAADDAIQRDTLNDTVNRLKKGQGINRQIAIETWGKAVVDRMPKGLKKVFKKDGQLPDEVAYEEGFSTAEDLFNALEGWETESMQKRRYVAQRQLEYQNSLNPDEFLVDTAEFAEYLGIIGNYTSGKMGEAAQLEERLAGRKGGRTVMARSAFKKYAKTIIRDMPVRDAVRADLFTAAMKRASQAEAAAIKRGDWATAQKASEQMRLNFEMAQESRRIKTEKEKHERMAKRVKKAKPDKVQADYLGAALKLAQRFNLIKLGGGYDSILQKAGDIRTLLVDNSDVMGPDEYGFSTELLVGDTPFDYRDLNADELNEVAALIRALVKKGRDKINPKLTSLDVTMDEARESLIAAAGELKSKTKWAKRGRAFFGMDPVAWLRRLQDKARSHYADTYQMWAMLRILDGFTYYTSDKRGPFETYFRDNLEVAYAKKNSDTNKYEPMIRAAVTKLFKRGKNRRKMPVWLSDQIPVPAPKNLTQDGRQWDFEAVAAVALNMGNESNLARLKDGYGWTDDQLKQIVSILTDEEWSAVQELWDVFEQMRPEFFKASERIHGVEPPRIVPRPFTTPTGKVMQGGYAPAVYDRSNVRAAELDEKALLRESANAGHQRPAVNSRATKSRAVTAGGMPIRLDLSGIARQFDYNLQYTAFAESIRDIARMLNDQEVADTIADKVGTEWLPAMRTIMSHVANPGIDRTANYATRMLKSMGANASKWVLGGNRPVGVKQLFSIPAVYVEGGSWHRGFRQIVKNPLQAWEDMLEASPNMRGRLQGVQLDREIAFLRQKLMAGSDLTGVPAEVIDAVLFAYIRFFDALAVFPAWYGTKQKMERKYGPGARAILETDKIIFDTQPITREMDLSGMQLNRNSLSRILTFFSGFTMKFENRKRVYVRGFLEGKIPLKTFMTHVMVERIMPPMLMNLLFTLGAGDDPEADDVFWDVLLYQVCGFPVVRELSVFAANAVRLGYDEEFRSFSAFGTPLGTIPKAFEWNMNTIARWSRGDEEDKEAAVAVVDLLLATKGVPAVKIVKDFQESARQFDHSDGWDRWFKLLFKPDPKERE